jgi:hypothetical protein
MNGNLDIVDLLQDMKNILDSNPILNIAVEIAAKEIKNQRNDIKNLNVLQNEQKNKLYTLYSNIKPYISSCFNGLNINSKNDILKKCSITQFEELENKIYSSTTIDEFDNLYACMEHTLSELEKVCKLASSTVSTTTVPAHTHHSAPPVPVVAASASSAVPVVAAHTHHSAPPAPVVVPTHHSAPPAPVVVPTHHSAPPAPVVVPTHHSAPPAPVVAAPAPVVAAPAPAPAPSGTPRPVPVVAAPASFLTQIQNKRDSLRHVPAASASASASASAVAPAPRPPVVAAPVTDDPTHPTLSDDQQTLKDKIITNLDKKHRGLKNHSVTCYMNSMIQMLSYIPEFIDVLNDNRKLLPSDAIITYRKNLINVFEQMFNGDNGYYTIDLSIFDNFKHMMPRKNFEMQEDSIEFFQKLLISLKIGSQPNDTQFYEIAFDQIKTYVCRPPNSILRTPQIIQELVLILPVEDGIDIESTIIEQKAHIEPIDDLKNCGNPDTTQHGPGEIKTDYNVKDHNKYLIIQLRRFFMDNLGISKKDNTKIYEINETLSFSNVKYTLVGIILHQGVIASGHFTFLKMGSNKILYNDGYVTDNPADIPNEDEINTQAYMLLYKRDDVSPSSTGGGRTINYKTKYLKYKTKYLNLKTLKYNF